MEWKLGAGCKIDVGERINLIHYDIAIVGTDAGRDTADALTLIAPRDGMKLAALNIAFDRAFIEKRSYDIDAILIAYENNLIRQMLRTDMQMKNRAVSIDNQLTSGKNTCHGNNELIFLRRS